MLVKDKETRFVITGLSVPLRLLRRVAFFWMYVIATRAINSKCKMNRRLVALLYVAFLPSCVLNENIHIY